jgi:hypothetical protein
MADDLKDRGALDRARVNIEEDYERRYWSEKFGVSQDELMKAVDEVGNSAKAVARQLGKEDPF